MIAGLFIYGAVITAFFVVMVIGNEQVAAENRDLKGQLRGMRRRLAETTQHPSATVLPFKREGK